MHNADTHAYSYNEQTHIINNRNTHRHSNVRGDEKAQVTKGAQGTFVENFRFSVHHSICTIRQQSLEEEKA